MEFRVVVGMGSVSFWDPIMFSVQPIIQSSIIAGRRGIVMIFRQSGNPRVFLSFTTAVSPWCI